MISLTPTPIPTYISEPSLVRAEASIAPETAQSSGRERWLVFAVAVFLVSVPVFLQAPLVRLLPWCSLGLTPVLFLLGRYWLDRPKTALWGDLLIGFAWTWLAGSIYWGWLRWEPLIHLPLEAIGLPFALWGISRNWGKVGNFFYIGSLSGTVITDLYFYVVGLIPHWRSLMQVETEAGARPILQSAIAQITTPQGLCWAAILLLVLLMVSLMPLRFRPLHWWAFSGAAISTLLVDGLFWFAAAAA